MVRLDALAVAGVVALSGSAFAQEAPQALPEKPKVLVPASGTHQLVEAIPTSKGFLIGWANGYTANVQSFSPTGKALKPAVKIRDASLLQALTKFAPVGGDKFAVIWKQFAKIEGGIFDINTNKISGIKTELATSYGALHHEIVALSNGRLAIGTMEVKGIFTYIVTVSTFDKSLNRLSGPVSMNGEGFDTFTTSRDFTIVDAKSGGFAVWRDRPSGNLFMKAFTPQGGAKGKQVKINTTPLPNGSFGDITAFGVQAKRLTNDHIVVAWTSLENLNGALQYDIRARLFSADGKPIGKDFRVNTDRVETQYFPEIVALPNGKFTIGWVSNVFSTLTRSHLIRTYAANGKALSAPKVTYSIVNPFDGNIDTDIERLKDGSLVRVFHEGIGQAIVADGIPQSQLKEKELD